MLQRALRLHLAILKEDDAVGAAQRRAAVRDGEHGHRRSTIWRAPVPPAVGLVVEQAPGGRVLAYLSPAAGVDLEVWVGRSAAVIGARVPYPELKTDLITVTRLVPVRLAP